MRKASGHGRGTASSEGSCLSHDVSTQDGVLFQMCSNSLSTRRLHCIAAEGVGVMRRHIPRRDEEQSCCQDACSQCLSC